MNPGEDILLRIEHASKRFGSTQALDDVSVEFRRGEIHALMGENGAGKSTLGKAIAGLHRLDSGTISIAGHALRPGSIDEAFASGVRIVHQELAQCPNLSVAENLCLHDIPTRRLGIVDRRAMQRRASVLLERLEPGIDPRTPLGSLSPGRRQIVQIASALDERAGEHGARVIVFDEPTSSLSIAEADRLLEITRQLARDGLTIIYVSHRMGEIFALCDRVTVLRDGKFVATSPVRSIDEPTLVEQMIGRKLEATPRAAGARADAGAERLAVVGLDSPGKLHGVNLDVRAGEILGVGGLVGSGRSELLDAIFGLDPRARGTVRINGQQVQTGRPREAVRAGVGYVPEDRRLQGLFFQMDLGENIALPAMPRLARALGIRHLARERSLVRERIERFRIKARSRRALPGELSGGNQQKLLIARWMGDQNRVLLLDEPTRGIDVGTKSEIHRLVRQAADEGAGILLVSSEMPELLALSDRILVMASGRIAGELRGTSMTQAEILRLATSDDSRRPRADARHPATS